MRHSPPAPSPGDHAVAEWSPQTNGAFRLGDFVVGECNRVTYLAACRTWEKGGDGNGEFCNPLFVYGKAGVGKTHLIQGTFHTYQERHPRRRTLHVTGEQFSNGFRASLRNGTVSEFRDRYRSLHLLVVDDVQALAGKTATQVEFLYTFEELHRMGSRVVLAADRHPSQLHSIRSSLLGRFQGGFVVRLDSPDIPTRLAILRAKCRQLGHRLDDEILQLLAGEGNGNVREILGALTKVIARATFCGEEVSVEMARRILEGLRAGRTKQVTFRQIERAVTRYFGIRPSDLRSRSRRRSMALPRQISMYLARQWGGYSLKEIGDHFGGKSHTTVTYSDSRIRERLKEDGTLRNTVERLQAEILC